MNKDYKPKLDERNKVLLEMINPKPTQKFLVIGTGVYPKSEFFLYERANCKNIVGSDIDENNIKKAQSILPKLEFIYLDAQKEFPLKDNEFDFVILTEVLEHLKNQTITLNEINRVLKKNGKLVMSVPKRRWFNIFSPITHVQHVREYDEKKIKRILEDHNFNVEVIITGGSLYDLLNLWVHLILKYGFRTLYTDHFFEKKVNKFWKREIINSGKYKGFDILVRASALKK